MTVLESFATRLRHSRLLKNSQWLWNGIRPIYNKSLSMAFPRGIPRVINGTDRIRISPAVRQLTADYEPEVWAQVMAEVRPGDIVADVGAFVGLYAIAIARRLGKSGQVIAFEPQPENFRLLLLHAAHNDVEHTLRCENLAVAAVEGLVGLSATSSESHITASGAHGDSTVRAVTLDTYFAGRKVDILKIDVEGFEQAVLEGGLALLADAARRPRMICVEVHPFAWGESGASSEAILGLLTGAGYEVVTVEGTPVDRITAYGEIIARAEAGRAH